MSRFDLASVALRWLCGWWLLWHVALVEVSRVRRGPDGMFQGSDDADPAPSQRALIADLPNRPPCSIVIPARNESARLPVLLASLATERRPADEVLVVDDDSDDDTAAVALAGGAQVLTAPVLPAGWTGKNSACWAGADQASHDVLLFLDADVQFEAGGLDRVLGAHHERGGLLSVQPFHDVPRPYEQLSAFFNVIAMMGIDAFTPLGERRTPTGAFGPVLVTNSVDYEAVGGHRAVAAEVLDDVALARSYTDAGRRVTCLGGRGTVRFRMYPSGLGQLVEGWTKNFAGGAAGTRKLTLLLVAAWVSLCIQATYWVVALPWRATSMLIVAAVYAVVATQLWGMLRRIGSYSWATAALFPISLAAFLTVFVRSLVHVHLRHRVTWKGRQLAT